MAGGGGGGESGEPEFQIAPMIDVLLVLLIFFMSITTAQVLKVDKAIVLPVSANAKPREAEVAKHEIAVNVRWDPSVTKAFVNVDDKNYDNLADLIPVLAERLKRDPQLIVIVRGDKNLPAIEIQRVMDTIGQAGIADISFSASNR
ncbi:MAG: biopolymer transporter ExbD [Gloeobacteraceae cyanobacterium ES-bin-144]|nr:biopolymer transporter ExbD [Verrucomicrobiales bacterium]